MGTDDGGHPFSKSAAVNDAYQKSTGDMLVIADADSWCEREVVMSGIDRAARREHLVVPWWNAHRLTREDSKTVMAADPRGDLPVTDEMRERCKGDGPSPASAAMVLCIQRVSFERVGGWDERFRGWGSEDVSFGFSTWALLGRNEYTMGESFALYHPQPKNKEGMRVWKNDEGLLNMPLYERYRAAQANPYLMTQICQEHPLPGAAFPIGPAPTLNDDEHFGFVPEMDADNPPLTAPITREPLTMDDTVTI
jgi:hypothetical protein